MRTLHNRFGLRCLVAVLSAGVLAFAGHARADSLLTNFTGFDLNNFDGTAANLNTPTDTVLTLTTANNTEQANSGVYNAVVPIQFFNVSFVYQETPGTDNPANDPADGVTFMVENDSRGNAAVGGPGNGMGYGLQTNVPTGTAISPSVAIELHINLASGTAAGINGSIGPYSSTTPALLTNGGGTAGDPILVQLSYASGTLTETLTDQDHPTDVFTTSYSVNIPTDVGGNTAFIGFTGGDGSGTSTQTISSFSFDGSATPISAPLPPAVWSGFGLLALAGVWGWRRTAMAA